MLIWAAIWGSSAHAGDHNGHSPAPTKAPQPATARKRQRNPRRRRRCNPWRTNNKAAVDQAESACGRCHPPSLDASSEPAPSLHRKRPHRRRRGPPPPPPDIVGSVFPIAPGVAPGTVPPRADDPLGIARERWLERDARGVVSVLSPWLETRTGPYGRTRHSATCSWASHTCSSRTGTSQAGTSTEYAVRMVRLPRLEPGTRPRSTTCEADTMWPSGSAAPTASGTPAGAHADECLLLIGDASRRSRQSFRQRGELQKVPGQASPDPTQGGDSARIHPRVRRLGANQAIWMLHDLALSHSYPSTDLAVQSALDELREQGHEVAPPDDATTRMRRAEALRRSGRYDAAWSLFQELTKAATTDDRILKWAESNEERSPGAPESTTSTPRFLPSSTKHPPTPRWHGGYFAPGRETVGMTRRSSGATRVSMITARTTVGALPTTTWRGQPSHAGLYEESAERWSKLTRRGGSFGRKARFYSAFASYRHGDLETAIAGFDKLLEYPGTEKSRALYWRPKPVQPTVTRMAQRPTTRPRQPRTTPAGTPWCNNPLPKPVMLPGATVTAAGMAYTATPARVAAPRRTLDHGGPAFPLEHPITRDASGPRDLPSRLPPQTQRRTGPRFRSALQKTAHAPVQHEPVVWPGAEVPAATPLPEWLPGLPLLGPRHGPKRLLPVCRGSSGIWPSLPAAHDLARAGEYTDAARLVYAAYAEWQQAWSTEDTEDTDDASKAIRELKINTAGWRPFLLFVRDHYHAARACHGLHKSADDDLERNANLRLSYPVVEPVEIWRHSQTYNVDPYLVMGIMRQESTYRNTALSPVGAIGPHPGHAAHRGPCRRDDGRAHLQSRRPRRSGHQSALRNLLPLQASRPVRRRVPACGRQLQRRTPQRLALVRAAPGQHRWMHMWSRSSTTRPATT